MYSKLHASVVLKMIHVCQALSRCWYSQFTMPHYILVLWLNTSTSKHMYTSSDATPRLTCMHRSASRVHQLQYPYYVTCIVCIEDHLSFVEIQALALQDKSSKKCSKNIMVQY